MPRPPVCPQMRMFKRASLVVAPPVVEMMASQVTLPAWMEKVAALLPLKDLDADRHAQRGRATLKLHHKSSRRSLPRNGDLAGGLLVDQHGGGRKGDRLHVGLARSCRADREVAVIVRVASPGDELAVGVERPS